MPELPLTPASSLGFLALPSAHAGNGENGVTVAERTGMSLCNVLARKGAQARLTDRVRQAHGIELPREPRYTSAGSVGFVWAGPSQWLAFDRSAVPHSFEPRLRATLAGMASVMDQSDGRTVVRVRGPRARDALAKGVLIDLHPSVFQPGHAAVTTVAHIGVHMWQLDAAPTYELAMFRSFAVSFWEWLVDAAAEFGVSVQQS